MDDTDDWEEETLPHGMKVIRPKPQYRQPLAHEMVIRAWMVIGWCFVGVCVGLALYLGHR